jgi:archaellum biogenesis protein FlaJ (TadC family)
MKQFLAKFKSIKVLITVWCMVLLTHIVIHNLTNFIQLAIILAAAPLVYCGVNVLQDKIYKGENNNNESKVK